MTSVAAFVTVYLSPEGKNGTLSACTRLVSTLALICVIVSPLNALKDCDSKIGTDDFLSGIDFPTNADCDALMTDKLSSLNAAQLELSLSTLICQRFGIGEADVEVNVEYSVTDSKTEFSRVLVLLSGKGIFKDPRSIEEYVYGLCRVPCDCALK